MIDTIFKLQTSSTIEILKWLAILSMVIDHMGVVFFDGIEAFRIVGRLSFPLFGFILVHNYLFFTKGKKKYLLRLWAFGLISQPFHSLVLPERINIFILLAFSLSVLFLADELNKKYSLSGPANDRLWSALIPVGGLLMIPVGYGFFGYLFILSIWYTFTHQGRHVYLLGSTFLVNLTSYKITYMLAAFIVFPVIYIVQKNTLEVKRMSRYFFYLFYPLHLSLFLMIKTYIN